MKLTPDHAESILLDLPDPSAARIFVEELERTQPGTAKKLKSDAGLYSDAVALAAWSPLLATTLLQNREYFAWLSKVRKRDVTRAGVELVESLGRFAGTHSQLTPHDILSRFRRRELLRIYLQDIRRTGTVSEITEELSHLADAILTFAFRLARQEMENRFGAPQLVDSDGRIMPAKFAVVALGKLGSLELNFASDIDLMFLFSADGLTSGKGTQGQTTNREFFNRLARSLVQMVGEQSGEGAAYRVDLRLRPYGRDGALASSVDEAVRYYADKAQAWELQALIRSRCAAGPTELFDQFSERIAPFVFSPAHTWAAVSASNASAKKKIDVKIEQGSGEYNVKLGRGGIREIEFIAQAQGMARGGNDPWLRSPHTLIALGRLAERQLISDRERIELFRAYEFLRTLEHRLQMENGLQTHVVPDDKDRRRLVARRMGFAGPTALQEFDQDLLEHAENVKGIFDRILGKAAVASFDSVGSDPSGDEAPAFISPETPDILDARELPRLAGVFAERLNSSHRIGPDDWMSLLDKLKPDPNFPASWLGLNRIAASLDRSDVRLDLSRTGAELFLRLCSTSEPFGEMFSSNPALIDGVNAAPDELTHEAWDVEIAKKDTFADQIGALRRVWARQLVAIGALDAAGRIDMRESNRRQTLLAEASLDQAWKIVVREMEARFGPPENPFRLTVLGLGRLGGEGMDYGSDLDVVLVYDDKGPSPFERIPISEVYARAVELFATALSSLTRDGYLYRVDLRLRPDGRNGPASSGARAFLDYLKFRSQPWEWLAYVKLRAAALGGDWGTGIENAARAIIHERAEALDPTDLRSETKRVRERLEQEQRSAGAGIEIKHGPGGMLDVYFATRYLQLRDGIPDTPGNRTTTKTLDILRESGALNREDHAELSVGYAFLRALDHRLRLAKGRVRRLPSGNAAALVHIAESLNEENADALIARVVSTMESIRNVYSRILM